MNWQKTFAILYDQHVDILEPGAITPDITLEVEMNLMIRIRYI